MGILGPPGAWSLGTPVAGEQQPHLPPVSTGAGRPPLRRLSKSLPASPTAAGHFASGAAGVAQYGGVAGAGVQGGAFSPEGAYHPNLDVHLQNLLEQERHRAAVAGGGGAFSSTSSPAVSRPPSPGFYSHSARPSSPTHSRSSSPLPGAGADQKALLRRVVELERAYGELARAYERLELEKEEWRALASPAMGGGSRSGSASPRGISPSGSRSSSRPPSRPPSPAHHPRPLHASHAHSHSLTSLSSLAHLTPSVGGGAGIVRPSSALGAGHARTGSRGLHVSFPASANAAGGGISRPASAAGERRFF
ncbi:hypothetical protein JCM6882_001365 [Rhodosporidiobolus microsporus]